jgi:signal transduction histidine kinase
MTELSALVADVADEFEDMGEDVTLGDTARIVLPVRATWLRRAMRNLVSNALRYGQRACRWRARAIRRYCGSRMTGRGFPKARSPG